MATGNALQRVIKPVQATIDSSRTVCEAVTRMRRLGTSAILVVDSDGVPVGVLTQRDVLSMIAADLDPHLVLVEQAISEELVTVSLQTTPEEAMQVMLERSHDELLVVDRDLVCGLVSMSDVTRLLVEDRDARIRDLTFYITHG